MDPSKSTTSGPTLKNKPFWTSRQRTLGSVAILAHAVMQPSLDLEGYAEGMELDNSERKLDVDGFLKPFEERSKKQLKMILLRKEGSRDFELVLERSQKLSLLQDEAFEVRECLLAAGEFSGLRNRRRRPAIGAAAVRGAAAVLTLRSRSRSRSRVLRTPSLAPDRVKFTKDAMMEDPVALANAAVAAFRRRGRPPPPAQQPPPPPPLPKARPKTKTPAAADPAPPPAASSDRIRHPTARASDLRARGKTLLTATSLLATHVQGADGRLVRRPVALAKAAKPPAVGPKRGLVWRDDAAASSSSGAARDDDWGASWPAPSASLRLRPTQSDALGFDPAVANGSQQHPAVANGTSASTWNKYTMKTYFPKEDEEGSAAPLVEIRGFLCFLDNKRPGPDGLPISRKLGQPEPQANGWWRLPWISFDEAALPTEPLGEWDTEATWNRAWHGTKIEALYSIMYHGKLAASHDAELGHRFFEGLPGVYVFRDDLRAKAEPYAHFVPLFQDGVFWSAVWEVFVDRSARVPLSKVRTDQWAQEERSVRLAALWVCGRTHDRMEAGARFAERWHPEHEVNPRAQRFVMKRPRAPRTGCIGARQR